MFASVELLRKWGSAAFGNADRSKYQDQRFPGMTVTSHHARQCNSVLDKKSVAYVHAFDPHGSCCAVFLK